MKGKFWLQLLSEDDAVRFNEGVYDRQFSLFSHLIMFQENMFGSDMSNLYNKEFSQEDMNRVFDGQVVQNYLEPKAPFLSNGMGLHWKNVGHHYDVTVYWSSNPTDVLDDDHVVTFDGEIHPIGDVRYVDCCNCYMTDDQISDADIVFSDYDDKYYYLDDVCHVEAHGYVYSDLCIYVDSIGEHFLMRDVDNGYTDIRYCEGRGEYYHLDDLVWDDNSDEYVHVDDYEDDNGYTFEYKNGPRSWKAGRDAEWRVGFEIEKEDSDMYSDDTARDLYDRTYWTKEYDGSLDHDCGFELISPTLDLFNGNVEDGRSMDDELWMMRHYINADASIRCGGHINLSHKDMEQRDLFNSMKGFMPLLYALYPHRARNNSYAAAKRKGDNGYEKYSAVHIKSSCIEFRIFGSVRNLDNLKWRIDLIRLMTKNLYISEIDVIKQILDARTNLHKHLLKVYTQEQLITKARLAYEFARDYEFNYAAAGKTLHRKKVIKLPRQKRINKLTDSFFTITSI